MSIVRWLVVVLAACAALTPARSESQQVWGAVRLPGGAAAARRAADLGADEGRLDAGFLIDFVRRYFASPEASPAIETFERYLTYITAVDQAVREWSQGCRLPLPSEAKAARDRVRDYLALLGLELREQRGRYVSALSESDEAEVHRRWLDAVGVDVPRLADELNAGRAITITVPSDDLPLPLPAYWNERARSRERSVLLEVVRSPAGAYLYHGLLGMDERTLRFFAERPAFMESLASNSGAAFGIFGRSLRVTDTGVDVPGGPAASDAWRSLVGRAPDDRERFIASLLGVDRGRLAFFYDAVDQLDRTHQDFALGARLPRPERSAFLRNVYTPFLEVEPAWNVMLRPFSRPTFDPSLVLRLVDVGDGSVAGHPWWPSVLERVAEGNDWPVERARTLEAIRPRPVDAAWLLNWIFDVPSDARSRFQLIRFAQRNYADLDNASAPALEIGLRTFWDMPALAGSLERLGVRDPEVFERIAWSARRLTASSGRDEALPVLKRWQAAVGLLEQVQRHRRLPPDQVEKLLTSFVTAFPERADRAAGAAGRWLSRNLLSEFVALTGRNPDLDEQIMVSFAGVTPDPARSFSWEGLNYVVDPRRAVLRVLSAMPKGPQLGDLVALENTCEGLSHPAASVAQLQTLVTALRELEHVVRELPASPERNRDVDRYQTALTYLERISKTADLGKISREIDVCWRTVDAVTDAAVPKWIYALAVGSTDMSPDVLADMAARHSLRAPRSVGPEPDWRLSAWRLPQQGPRSEEGVTLYGALLGVDLALYPAQLRRLTSNDSPRPAQINEGDERAVIQWLVLRDGVDSVDASVSVQAIARGRERVADFMKRGVDANTLRSALLAATVDEWRSNLLVWLFERSAFKDGEALLLSELAAFGQPGDVPARFPFPSLALDGCLCAGARPPSSLEAFRGRDGVVPALTPDLWLRIAEHLSALGLPPSLAAATLPFALQDWLDHIHQPWADDWEAVTTWPRRLRRERVEEYLLELVADRTLAPPPLAKNLEARP